MNGVAQILTVGLGVVAYVEITYPSAVVITLNAVGVSRIWIRSRATRCPRDQIRLQTLQSLHAARTRQCL
jgi:hypothetical protein